jgi:hypothetical protein
VARDGGLAGSAPQLAFVSRTLTDVRAHSLLDGSPVWSTTTAPPPDGRAWYVRGMAYAPRTDVLLVALHHASGRSGDASEGVVAALRGATGAVLWRTASLCVMPRDSLTIAPGAEDAAFATCADGGPATAPLPGKLAVLSMADGSVTQWVGHAGDTMASGPSLAVVAAAAAGGRGAPSRVAAVYGTAGGALVAGDAGTGATLATGVMPDAAAAVTSAALNVYPAFTFAPISDADGVLYAAAGDDRGLAVVALPGLAAPPAAAAAGGGGGGGSSTGSGSPSPSANASPSPGGQALPPELGWLQLAGAIAGGAVVLAGAGMARRWLCVAPRAPAAPPGVGAAYALLDPAGPEPGGPCGGGAVAGEWGASGA